MLRKFGAKLLFACFLFFSLPIVVQASPIETSVVDQQLDKLGIEDVKQFWDGLVKSMEAIYQRVKKEALWSL